MTDVLSNQTMQGKSMKDKTMQGKTVQAGLPWLLALMCLFVLSLASCETAQDTKVQAKGNVEILIKGSPFRGTNGIAWGPDNLIWMGSVMSGKVVAVDPKSGEVRHTVALQGADDLAFHPDGRLYMNYIATGNIGLRMPNGKASIAAKVGPGNNGIAISKDGRMFVSQLFLGSKFYEIYPDGKRKPREIADQGKQMSNGMNFGPDGKLYGSAFVTGEVTRINIETGAIETVASNVGIPSSVKFNSKGELHVLNIKEGAVSKVNIKTGRLELVARLPFPATDNMCFSPDDRLFVSSAGDGYLWEVTGKDTQRVVVQGGLGIVGGVALAEAQGRTNLMAVDAFAIRKFDPESGEAISAVRDVTLATEVGWMLTVSNHGKQLVTSSWPGNFIKIWDPETNSMVVNFDKIKGPTNAISLGDDIVFADLAGNVKRFSPKSPQDKPKILAKNLKQPFGLAYDNGNLYVSEDLGGRVLQVLDNDKVIDPRVIKDGLNAPQGLAISNGQLLVVEAGAGKLLTIDPANGSLRTLADGMKFTTGKLVFAQIPNWPRASITVSGNTAYIAGTRTAVIYKVTF